jgi:sodium-dependent dicarboxylate transporter 2/3/5
MADVHRGEGQAPRSLSRVSLLLGPLLAIALLLFADLSPGKPEVTRTAAVALLMAVWWVGEALPLAITALLPIVLFPALGIMNGKIVAPIYFNHIIFLFIGGFIVALAMQRWELHRRIALRVLLLFGTKPRNLLLGFMTATAFLSMWVSNTATTMMMVPIALAVLLELEPKLDPAERRHHALALLLGVAYAASLGGIATLVGTPPNLSFARIFEITFPGGPEISFASWMLFALPISLVFLIVVWLLLSAAHLRGDTPSIGRDSLRGQYEQLGPMRFEEKVVLADFTALALLWLTRADLRLGSLILPGWSRLFPHPSYRNDGSVAITMALLLFMLPSRERPGERIMDWGSANKLPWNIVLLFGGGFALASGFKESGLSLWIGDRLAGALSLHPILIIAALCLLITFLTELTSNTATAEMLLPILAALAISIGVNPLLLMIPGTLSCSLAFMLPVATPPNAIIFGTNRVRIGDMARTGVLLNFIGVLFVTLATWWIGRAVFGIDLAVLPDWARIL